MNEPQARDLGSTTSPAPAEPRPPASEPARRVDLRRLFLLAAAVYCAAKLALLAALAWNTQFVMDEFSQAAYSIRIPAGFYENLDPQKTVLYVYFYQLARLLSDGAVELMHLARVQTLGLALGMLGFAYATLRNLGARRAEALFAVCVLLSFSNFMERSFRIRSDNVAVFLACAALWLATRRGVESRGAALGAGVLVGAAFCSTQKAAYFFAAFALAYLLHWVVAWRRHGPSGRALTPGLAFGAGWVAAVLAYAVYFGGAGFTRVLAMIFSSPAEVALHADEFYTGLSRYIGQTLIRNPLAYALCLAGLLAAARRWKALSDARRLALVVSLVMTVLIALHNQPWPYVFMMALPFLALWSGEAVEQLAPAPERRAVTMLVLTALLAVSLGRNVAYLDNHNLYQCLVVAQAESLLGPEDRYADGIGMVATRHLAAGSDWWDAMNATLLRRAAQAGDHSAVDRIFRDRPRVWIDTYRLQALAPFLEPYFEDAYVRVYPNVLLAGRQIAAEPARFVAWWPGAYRLYGEDGQPLDRPYLLDGRELRGETRIDAGVHQVALAPPSEESVAFLLPAGLTLPPLPARGRPISLFARVYE